MAEYKYVPIDLAAFQKGQKRSNTALMDGKRHLWRELVDPDGYVKFEQLMAVTSDGVAHFPKIHAIWKAGVFVLPARINPDRGAEILLIDELRPLVKDENGERGNVIIRSIPQGIPRGQETLMDAGKRIVLRETGHQPSLFMPLSDRILLDAANSETRHLFALAQVPFQQEPKAQQLYATEHILRPGIWMTLPEIDAMDPPIECIKALGAIQLGRGRGILQSLAQNQPLALH